MEPQKKIVKTLAGETDQRVDSIVIPRPINHIRNEQLCEPAGNRVYSQSTSIYNYVTYVERLDSSARYIKLSQNLIPKTKKMAKVCNVPFCAILTPIPKLTPYESRPPRIDLNTLQSVIKNFSDPTLGQSDNQTILIRCEKCGSYINGYYNFSNSSATCNICEFNFTIPNYYQLLLHEHYRLIGDSNQFRQQIENFYNLNDGLAYLEQPLVRSELLKGTVDYITHNYITKNEKNRSAKNNVAANMQKNILGLIICVDILENTGEYAIKETILQYLYHALLQWPETTVDLCIMFFSDCINYIKINQTDENLKLNSICTITNLNEPFVPFLPSKLFLRLNTASADDEKSRNLIEKYASFTKPILKYHSDEARIGKCSPIDICATAVKILEHRECYNNDLNHARGGSVLMFTCNPPYSDLSKSPSIVETTDLVDESKDYNSSTEGNLLTKSLDLTKKIKNSVTSTINNSSNITNLFVNEASSTVFTAKFSDKKIIDEIVEKCITNAVWITIVLLSSPKDVKYKHSGTYLEACRRTGGNFFFYDDYVPYFHYEKIYNILSNYVNINLAYDCSFRFRKSKELEISKVAGQWTDPQLYDKSNKMPSITSLPRIDENISINYLLDYSVEEILVDNVYFQFGITYTNYRGERVLRIINKELSITNTLTAIFKSCETEALIHYYSRLLAFGFIIGKDNREFINNQLISILTCYRIHSAMSTSLKQLVIPDSFKTLPVFIVSLFKLEFIRKSRELSDKVVKNLSQLLFSSLTETLYILYPLIYPVYRADSTDPTFSLIGGSGAIKGFYWVPASCPSSGSNIRSDSVYLMDDGISFYVYVGNDVSTEVINEILTENFIPNILVPLKSPIQSDDPHSLPLINRIWNLIAQLQYETNRYKKPDVSVILMNSIHEKVFVWKLVEDRLSSEMGYIDYLVRLHNSVNSKISDS